MNHNIHRYRRRNRSHARRRCVLKTTEGGHALVVALYEVGPLRGEEEEREEDVLRSALDDGEGRGRGGRCREGKRDAVGCERGVEDVHREKKLAAGVLGELEDNARLLNRWCCWRGWRAILVPKSLNHLRQSTELLRRCLSRRRFLHDLCKSRIRLRCRVEPRYERGGDLCLRCRCCGGRRRCGARTGGGGGRPFGEEKRGRGEVVRADRDDGVAQWSEGVGDGGARGERSEGVVEKNLARRLEGVGDGGGHAAG